MTNLFTSSSVVNRLFPTKKGGRGWLFEHSSRIGRGSTFSQGFCFNFKSNKGLNIAIYKRFSKFLIGNYLQKHLTELKT